jgi:predicted chitinase
MVAHSLAVALACVAQVLASENDSPSLMQRGTRIHSSLVDYTPDKTKAGDAFAAAGGTKSKITDNWDYIKDAVKDAGITNDQHFALFVANLMQETGCMTTKTESSDHYTKDDYDWSGPNKTGVHYYGRGYLQLTWKVNYGKANKTCTKNDAKTTVDIVTNPGEIETSENLAWCTAAWYWKENVQDDRCKPTCDLSMTIDAINGNQECPKKSSDPANKEAKRRYCFFKKFWEKYQTNKVADWQVGTGCGAGLANDCTGHAC